MRKGFIVIYMMKSFLVYYINVFKVFLIIRYGMHKVMLFFYKKKVFTLSLIVCIGLYFCSCSEKKAEDFSNIPGVQNETWPNIVDCKPEGELLIYTFKALNKWSAVSSDDWFEVIPSSGNRGNSKLKIVVDKNEDMLRTATITIHVDGYKDVVISLEQEIHQVEVKYEVNSIIDNYLAKNYLWNDDYKELSRDLAIPYVDFYNNFLQKTLMGMTTNTLDKKNRIINYDKNGNPVYGYTLYSYVDRIARGRSSRNLDMQSGVNHGIKKAGKIKSFGFSHLVVKTIVNEAGYSTGKYEFVVQAVYPNSPADTLGIGRGTIISQIDGQEVTEANYTSLYYSLLSPTKSNVKLLVEYSDSVSELSLYSEMLDPTPILANKVLEEGENRIGYLMYDAFDAAYDNDLLEVLADFKSKGITDLVLDLRYNGGGYVISSNMLSSCLIGNECRDKIFHYYRYNSSRMVDVEKTEKETGNTYDEAVNLFGEKYMFDDYFGVNLAPYSLGLKRLFILTTKNTASASESLINSLRGHGISVVIIGENTNGKNVGMETIEFESEGYIYELAPITFQGYNAQKETVPSDGILVDYAVNDWNGDYGDFGELSDSMFMKAYELIMGPSRTVVLPSVSHKELSGKLIKLPIIKEHPDGMIVVRNNVTSSN